ncbi:tetratricopeptide repeat protein [Symmachiella macrocystis]|nr:hypothetical protein [Symmachiella macrocystis]
MNRFILGLILATGLSCMVACLGTKEEVEKPAETVPAPPKIDPRHQPQTERVDKASVELKSMERVGTEEHASIAAEFFVKRFVQQKYRANGDYRDPLMKYFPKTEEWSAFGVLQGKEPNLPRYTVECFVHLNDQDDWECRLMRIDKQQVYAIDAPDPDVTLPNIKVGPNGKASPVNDNASVATEGDPETPQRTAEAKAAGDLRMAKSLMKRSPEKAKQRLQTIIDEFPETPAAAEASELIQTIKD